MKISVFQDFDGDPSAPFPPGGRAASGRWFDRAGDLQGLVRPFASRAALLCLEWGLRGPARAKCVPSRHGSDLGRQLQAGPAGPVARCAGDVGHHSARLTVPLGTYGAPGQHQSPALDPSVALGTAIPELPGPF